MADSLNFAFRPVKDSLGRQALRPIVPLRLSYGAATVSVVGLLDTGSDVNVLPHGVGLSLGAIWKEQTIQVELSGNLATYEARGIILTAHLGEFPAVDPAFAWTKAPHAPLILGQTNFFAEFDVCFFRSQNRFEVRVKSDN